MQIVMGDEDAEDPRVIVWDLDGTLWSPEMYQLYGGAPFARHEESGDVRDARGEWVRLLGDARAILAALKRDKPHIKVGVASTCDEPEWARECLRKIVVEGDAALEGHFHGDVVEIYKAYTKEVHLRAIAKKSSCALHEMMFFDNQRDNIGVAKQLGVFAVYTPHGVTNAIFEESMKKFREHRQRHNGKE